MMIKDNSSATSELLMIWGCNAVKQVFYHVLLMFPNIFNEVLLITKRSNSMVI